LDEEVEKGLNENIRKWLAGLTEKEKTGLKRAYACFVLADSMEMGANWRCKVALRKYDIIVQFFEVKSAICMSLWA